MANSKIQMGNDEFILFIRKNYTDCKTSNDELGRKIWEWLVANDNEAQQIIYDQPCMWGNSGTFIGADKLPKTATQFAFNRRFLTAIYDFLDELGGN